MSWDTEMVTMVRYLIGDVDPDTPTYDDDRLSTLILLASFQVKLDAGFIHSYSVNLDNGTLTPDPTGAGGVARDDSFMSLVSLKASAILSENEFRTYGGQGIRIKDGESEIDLRRDPATLKLMRDTFRDEYADKLYLYKLDQTSVGLAVPPPASGPLRLPWWTHRSWNGGC
jgi:hypothetical protein